MKERWYLWSINNDPETNQLLVTEIIGPEYAEDLYKDVLCTDGKKRDLYHCQRGHDQVKEALASIKKYHLKIQVFLEQYEGKVTRYVLLEPIVRRTAQDRRNRRMVHRSS